MFKKIVFIILITIVPISLFSQDTIVHYSSENFRSLEIKTGIGMNFGVIPINIIFQYNIKNNLSTVFFSEYGVPSRLKNTSNSYITSTYFHCIEAIGCGGTFGKERWNTSLYIIGGGKYYYSKLIVNEKIQEPILITSKILPELGFLCNLKIGKKMFYYTTQLYIPFYPFKMFTMFENNTTLSMGIGYKFRP
jgi:hypothetical protein